MEKNKGLIKEIKYEKILHWLFRGDLELNKRWWHRFIKVFYFLLFGIVSVGFIIAIFVEPYDDYFLSHNVKKITLKEYSKNYVGPDNDNTLYKFISNGDNFGIVINGELVNKNLYLSKDFTFVNGSVCSKDPLKYIEGIQEILIRKAQKEAETGYQKTLSQKDIENLKDSVEKVFKDDPERRCILFTDDNDIKDLENKQDNIVILTPNVFYYLELVLGVLLISFLFWVISALLYYKLLLYILFGNRSK